MTGKSSHNDSLLQAVEGRKGRERREQIISLYAVAGKFFVL
jgi:hypothetical protein